MNDECDGSGTDPLCDTRVLHVHCGCGEPMPPDDMMCDWCISEWLGVSIMNQIPVRETESHLDVAIRSSVGRRVVPNQSPTEYSPWEDHPEYKDTE